MCRAPCPSAQASVAIHAVFSITTARTIEPGGRICREGLKRPTTVKASTTGPSRYPTEEARERTIVSAIGFDS
jgi:hypothetical protein